MTKVETNQKVLDTLTFIRNSLNQLLTMNKICIRNIYPLLQDLMNDKLKALQEEKWYFKEKELYKHIINSEDYIKRIENLLNDDADFEDIIEEVCTAHYEIGYYCSVILSENKTHELFERLGGI